MNAIPFENLESGFIGRRGGLSDDLEFIAAKAIEGVSDQAIAKMVNRPLPDVQRALDGLGLKQRRRGQSGRGYAPPPPLPITIADLQLEIELMAEAIRLTEQRDALRRRMGELGIVGLLAPSTEMTAIAEDVAERYGVTVGELRGPQRARRYAVPRQEAMWLTMKTGNYATTQVGRWFGGRDHTTVMHACRAVEARLAAKAATE